MKTLLLIRHAHASLKKPASGDLDRPLTSGGQETARKVAMALKEKVRTPDLVISSPAVRTLDTAVILSNILGYPRHEILVESKIYYGTADDLFNLIVALPNSQDTVMITGHNPTITQLANSMMQNKIDYMPNNGVVCLQFEADAWEDIPLAAGVTSFTLTPDLQEI